MKQLLAPIFLLILLFPTFAIGETLNDLVEREGIHYKKFSETPFTGKITGLSQGAFKNGKRDGPWVGYHDNGQLKNKGNFKNGRFDGPWVSYHDNGQLSYKGNYKNGKEDGPWVNYWSTGDLWYKGDFKNGKRDGPWVSYDVDGDVTRWGTGTFKNGVKVD